jgi:hypothetical protein
MAQERKPKAEVVDSKSQKTTLPFLTWFVGAIDRAQGLKVHHMTAVRAYFESVGLKEEATQEEFDAALKRYGL